MLSVDSNWLTDTLLHSALLFSPSPPYLLSPLSRHAALSPAHSVRDWKVFCGRQRGMKQRQTNYNSYNYNNSSNNNSNKNYNYNWEMAQLNTHRERENTFFTQYAYPGNVT